jgi:hypothetical protein
LKTKLVESLLKDIQDKLLELDRIKVEIFQLNESILKEWEI